MRLTTHSDFALRVLIYLALRPETRVSVAEIAAAYDISRSHLTKVVWDLSQGGFITTTRGKAGGMQLARPADGINLGAVLRRTEPGDTLVECFGHANQCKITPQCRARAIFREAYAAFLAVFDRYTLAELAVRRDGLAEILQLDVQ